MPRGKAALQLVGFYRRSPEEKFITSLNLGAAVNQDQQGKVPLPTFRRKIIGEQDKKFYGDPTWTRQGLEAARSRCFSSEARLGPSSPSRACNQGEVFDATVPANILASGHLQPGRGRCSRRPSRRLTRLDSHETQDFRCIWANMIW